MLVGSIQCTSSKIISTGLDSESYGPSARLSARAYKILSFLPLAFWVDADPTIFAYEATLSVADTIRRAGSDEPAAIQRAFKTTTMQSLLGGGHALDDHNHAHTDTR
jgi:hypothetical protein